MNSRDEIDAILKNVHPPHPGDIDNLKKAVESYKANGDCSLEPKMHDTVIVIIGVSELLEQALNKWEALVEGDRPPPESA